MISGAVFVLRSFQVCHVNVLSNSIVVLYAAVVPILLVLR